MEIKVKDRELQFNGIISGKLELLRKQFHSNAVDRIELATVYLGDRRAALPQQLRPGLYDVLCDGMPIAKDLFLGQKQAVQWYTEEYKTYDNEDIYRHRLLFADLNVMPGEDFWLSYGGRLLQLPSPERNSSFDFLFQAERLELRLSEELRAYIELPMRGG